MLVGASPELITLGNAIALGGGAPAVASPATIFGAALTQWLDERGQSVSSWTDQSGAANTIAQGTAANRPIAGTAINGQPTLRFDGVNDLMTGPAISGLISAAAFSAWLVVRTKTLPAAGAFYLDPQFFGDADGAIGMSATLAASFWVFDGAYKASSLMILSDTTYVLRCIKGATGVRVKVTGTAEMVPTAAGNVAPLTGAFQQATALTSGYGAFELASQIFVNREATVGECAAMDVLLSAKYGMTA
jgi:hypothetical protein